jgi:hypothetical protein
VGTALEQLNREIFREEIESVERLLTKALQDVLSQPITLKADVSWRNNSAWVDFSVERDGNTEDIMRGQGRLGRQCAFGGPADFRPAQPWR